MNITSKSDTSSEQTLSQMNDVVYSIFCAGISRDEPIRPRTDPTIGLSPSALDLQRAGIAYDEVTILGNGKKAVDYFRTAFFGREPPNSSGLALLKQVTEEFADTEGRAITTDLLPDHPNVAGKIKNALMYYIAELPPEIIRERNFILYSYVGSVILPAEYIINDEKQVVGHSLLTLSRNAYCPEGGLPVVRAGVPTQTFSMIKS